MELGVGFGILLEDLGDDGYGIRVHAKEDGGEGFALLEDDAVGGEGMGGF